MESLTPREQRKRINAERMAKTMNSPMAVAARKKNAELESKRAAVLESGYERMRGIPEELRRPTPGSTNTGSRYQIIETRIFDEMLEELKQINTKTKRGNGGASP